MKRWAVLGFLASSLLPLLLLPPSLATATLGISIAIGMKLLVLTSAMAAWRRMSWT